MGRGMISASKTFLNRINNWNVYSFKSAKTNFWHFSRTPKIKMSLRFYNKYEIKALECIHILYEYLHYTNIITKVL